MRFAELVDVADLKSLCESFTAATGVVTAIVDLEGNVLSATGWQGICSLFHRAHPATRQRCLESDTALAGQLQAGQAYNIYRCKNGLIDVAVPILVGGEHVANFFTGQFFFEPPDEAYFLQQAEQFGFDRAAYRDALAQVPIVSEPKVRMLMDFLARLARIIGEMGLARKRVEETNAQLQQYKEHLEELVRARTADLDRAQEIGHIGSWRRNLQTGEGDWSAEMFRMFGLPPGESSVPFDLFLSRVHSEDRAPFQARVKEVITAKSPFVLEFRTIPLNGSPRILRAFGEVRCDAHGEPVEMIGINQDITEERQIQQVMAEAKEAAEVANRAKSAFLASMSHEFRTPLNAILGFSRLLQASPQATPAQLEHLELINRSGEHLLTLINNVLEISKIEAGRAELEETSFDLHQLIGVLQSLIQVQAMEKDLGFSVELAPELPCTVTADAGKLRQVLLNLLGNAVKYTPHGGVILRASVLAWEPPERARLRFEVEDSGVGIRPEDCSRLFIPFVQLANRPSTESGTGLGLVISKQYVELMGGHIEVRSQPDQGSIFSIEVPVKLAPREAVAIAPIAGRVIGMAPGQPHYRLLIVEDQPENRLLLREILEPLELELHEAANGQEAVTMCQQWHPDLVWMDIRMPVMDGVEATRRIKGRSTNAIPKIVALTAHALEEERREILAAGCDDFVRKPYREEEIFIALTRQLGMQFLYAAEPGATANETLVLSAEQLRPLPPAWLEELRQTAELLDGPRSLAVIARISQWDPPVGKRLRHMVENFQYKSLLTLLDQVTKRGDS